MADIREFFKDRLNYYREDIIKDIARLVAVPSVRDEKTAGESMPFGLEIGRAFDLIKGIAESFFLQCEEFDGYALHIDYGDSDRVLGILAHTDVVPAGELKDWFSAPYELSLRDGFMYGRGVNDDKASIIGFLYILRILKEAGFRPSKKIRLIVGGAEETTWECMNYYLKKVSPPDIAFSPDCDFPVVNCEKGILRGELLRDMGVQGDSTHKLLSIQSDRSHNFTLNQMLVKINTSDYEEVARCARNASRISFNDGIAELEYNGVKNMSRNPHRSPHGAIGFLEDFSECMNIDSHFRDILDIIEGWFPREPYGEKLGIAFSHEETGRLTMALCYISYLSGGLEIGFDIRYPADIEEDEILRKLKVNTGRDGITLQICQRRERLYIPPDSKLVTGLIDAYEAVMGERPLPLTKGGASYSRAIPNCVGFGPTFMGESPNSHKENECMNIDSFFRALNIYFEAILRL